jgi:phytoene/squalene synthetase
MRHEVDRTRGIFAAGAGLPAALGGRLGFETTLVLLGGLRILEMIEDRGYDVFTRRPVLGAPEWGRLLMRATVMRRRGIEAAIAR